MVAWITIKFKVATNKLNSRDIPYISCLHNDTFLLDEMWIGVRLPGALLEVNGWTSAYKICTPNHLHAHAPGARHERTEEKKQCSLRERWPKGHTRRGRVRSTSSRNCERCACNAKLPPSISLPCWNRGSMEDSSAQPVRQSPSATCARRKFDLKWDLFEKQALKDTDRWGKTKREDSSKKHFFPHGKDNITYSQQEKLNHEGESAQSNWLHSAED